jgi:diguanylate cyclase (GGDEF)-like protein/PAS domain S-box-containing protein
MIFLILSAFLFFAIYIFASFTIRTRQEELLSLEMDVVSADVNHFYDDFFISLDQIASFIKINGTTDLLDYIVEVDEQDPWLESIYLGTPDNQMINSSGFVPGPGFDLTTRPWYQLAILEDETIITYAFLNATEDKLITTVAQPVYDTSNEFIGVLAIDIDIETIKLYFENKKVGDTGFALIIDSNDHIVAHPNDDLFSNTLMELSYIGISLDDYNESSIHERVQIGDMEGSILWNRVLGDGYKVLIFMPSDEYYHTQNQFMNYFILVYSMVVIITLTFLWMNFKRIFTPINHLVKDLSKINVKDNIGYRLNSENNDVFDEIRENVNRALESSENYFNEAKSKAEELFLENQRFKYLINSTQDFIIHLDLKGYVVYASGSGLDKIELRAEDLINQHIKKFNYELFNYEKIVDDQFKERHDLLDWNYKEYFFETSISPIYDQNHKVIGSVLISRDVTEYKKRQAEIEYINQHDYLTDLYNRRMFIEKFNKLNQNHVYPITVMMMDLNGLKMLNDAFGHHVGDEALVEVAKAFRKVFKNDFVARIGGDEFAVILTNYNVSEIENLKHDIRKNVSSIVVKDISLSISVGYHMIDERGHNINDVLKEAENHMYRHKVTESMSVRNQAIRAIHKTLTDKFKEERIHSEKVSQLCYVMGLALGIKDELLEELKLAGLYHDIGKIAIPDAILDKPDTLTDEEFELMKTHTEIGYQILRAADDYSRLAEYALSHHERWDGKGYPRGIEKDDIPLFARIIALADSYDAMTTNRVYRSKMTKDKAIDELVRGAGKHYDPKLTKVFIKEVLKRPIEAEKVEL